MTISRTPAAIGTYIAVLFSAWLLSFNSNAAQVIIGTSSPTKTAVLGWNAVTGTNVAGYAVYYGTNSANLNMFIDAGTNTTCTVSNLSAGQTYYFAVTDYTAQYVQSAPSATVALVVTGVVQLQESSPGNMSVLFPVMPPHWYSIQASTNLTSWVTIGTTSAVTNNSWMNFSDTSGLPARFYRLCEH